MNDEDFISAFAACTLPEEQFHHADHVRAAWLFLSRSSVLHAISKFCEALRAYATSLGKPERYHETITWAYLLLVNERTQRDPTVATWAEFAAQNPDLLDWKNPVIRRYYSTDTLESPLARRVFVMPDLARSGTR